jgi:hypothetical protein
MSKNAFKFPPGGLRLVSTRARALPLNDYLENLSERAVRGEFRAARRRTRGGSKKRDSKSMDFRPNRE